MPEIGKYKTWEDLLDAIDDRNQVVDNSVEQMAKDLSHVWIELFHGMGKCTCGWGEKWHGSFTEWQSHQGYYSTTEP